MSMKNYCSRNHFEAILPGYTIRQQTCKFKAIRFNRSTPDVRPPAKFRFYNLLRPGTF